MRACARLACIALIGLALDLSAAQVAAADESAGPANPIRLGPGTKVRSIPYPAPERVRLEVEADADRFIILRLEQEHGDLALSYTRPDGRNVIIDSELGRDGHEVLVLSPSSTGLHRIDVSTPDISVKKPRFPVTWSVIDATEHPLEVEAHRSVMRATTADPSIGDRDWQHAITMYFQAAALWRRLDKVQDEATAVFGAAAVYYWGLANWQATAEYAARAADLFEEAGEMRLAANACALEAAAIIEMATESGRSNDAGELFDRADALFEEALAIQEILDRPFDVAAVVNNQGLTAYYRGRWDEARHHWSEAADRFHVLGEIGHEQNSLANLGVLEIETARFDAAIVVFSRVLEILPAGSSRRLRADTLDNRARARIGIGDYLGAQQDFFTALSIHEDIDNVEGQGRSLSGIATSYRALGEPGLARNFYQRALTYRRTANDGRGQFSTLRLLGDVEREAGDDEAALTFHREALEIAVTAEDQAKVKIAIAADLNGSGRFAEGEATATVAVALADEVGATLTLADALSERAVSRLGLSETTKAVADLEAARSIYARLGIEERLAWSLYLMARVAVAEDRLSDAIDLTGTAIDYVESLRARLGSHELRGTYLAINRAPYELRIAVAAKQAERSSGEESDRNRRLSLTTAERARARMMVDLNVEAALDVHKDVEPALRERRDEIYQRLSELRHRRARQTQRAGSDAINQLLGTRNLVARLRIELQTVEAELHRRHPAHAALADPPILDATGIQDMLADDTLLLQYAIGDRQSFVWSVTRDRIALARLPGRSTLEPVVRKAIETLRVYPSDQVAVRARDQALADLASLILDPITGLDERRRLLVVADDFLQYVPFSVLPTPGVDANRSRRLLMSHELAYVSSMSSLAVRRGMHETHADDAARVAVFADPAIPARRRNVSAVADGSATATDALRRLPPLLRAEEEARAIVGLAEQALPGGSTLVVGADATRGRVLGKDLAGYPYVHFALHSLVDTQYPALSALVLAPDPPHNDIRAGLLPVHEIAGLNLEAELVVLSACETALGREIRGEGLLGLTQGFFNAGAHRVLASLWWVPDRSTSSLMQHLYSGLLLEGMKPSTALRQAQLAIASQRRWADPYFWGAFILQGDW